MSDYQRFSRENRKKKKKNSKQKFFLFVGLAITFCIILFSLIVFGNQGTTTKEEVVSTNVDEKETNSETTEQDEAQQSDSKDENDKEDFLQQSELEDRIEAVEQDEDVQTKEIESSDNNVLKAYTGNWKAVETEQQGPHTTNYDNGSADREEIKEAVSQVTGVEKEHIIEHWVGNNGDQKVIATIQDKESSEYYRVYLEWVDNEGWKPIKVEELKNYS